MKLQSNDIYFKAFVSLSALTLIAAAIWFLGPNLIWEGNSLLAPPEKRLYVIIALFLLWLLKFLVIDLDSPRVMQKGDSPTQRRIKELKTRFYGACQFLKKTKITRSGKAIHLNDLPWHLLIGPSGAGKTSLLANSGVHYILHRQFQHLNIQALPSSENCDWWVTRDATMIDVPGKYLLNQPISSTLWRTLLSLIKQQQGKAGLSGIVLVLPLPDIMKQNDSKKYQDLLQDLLQRLTELKKQFPQPLTCQLIITKCDLLQGFGEFFGESTQEEIAQAWGITLPALKNEEQMSDIFSVRFNALIKKLNQQLLWRMHQERNPLIRPYIKDFPLQVERLKEFTLDFIKKFVALHADYTLQGIYLTSSLQSISEQEGTVLDENLNTSQRAVQVFKDPTSITRAYFVKHVITHGIGHAQTEVLPANLHTVWRRRAAYAASVVVIGSAALLLSQDFARGVKQTYNIQNSFADYQLSITQIGDQNERLLSTLKLLNSLQKSTLPSSLTYELTLLSFYTHKSQQKADVIYHQALQNILLPEVKKYLSEYLHTPVDKNTEFVYASLKAYLMLGDTEHVEADYVTNTFREILPNVINENETHQLLNHLHIALSSRINPLPLDPSLIAEVRHFFTSMPNLQLGYVILKNINNNNSASLVNLGTNENAVFNSLGGTNLIPQMFTSKAFPIILSQEATIAAQEAVMGNWVLGDNPRMNSNPVIANALIQQLRTTYVNNYIEVWESLLSTIHIASPTDLAQTDSLIVNLTSQDSPLLQLLQTLHENTYFEPITSTSQKLHNLGSLMDKTSQSEHLLYQIFTSLKSLHENLRFVLSAENQKKAAFEMVSKRMQSTTGPDAITQLRLVADKSPEPVKNWLDKIANDAWHLLMQDAAHYIDTSWQNEVTHTYQTEIANRYPFAGSNQEVNLKHFTAFFGNPGTMMNFYKLYLLPFVDTSNNDWKWKAKDNLKLPFSDETLRHIQHAMRIHHTFFPNGDDKLYVQFALQPYRFAESIHSVRVNINDKNFIDERNDMKNSHIITWPSKDALQMTSVQLILSNQHIINRSFPGDWGWFKLVNQAFDSVVTKKEVLINLSASEQQAKYLLFTPGQYNPFLLSNLQHFELPDQLTDRA